MADAAVVVIIHEKDYNSWGCPECGSRREPVWDGYGTVAIGSKVTACKSCERDFVLVSGNIDETYLPDLVPHKVQKHPREGKPFNLE